MIDVPESHFFLNWVVSGVAVLLTSYLIPGFRISGIFAAILAAVAIGFANAILWPILFTLSLPLTVLTLGLFTFVVNGAILKICAALLPGFEITSWLSAIVGAIALSLINMLLRQFIA